MGNNADGNYELISLSLLNGPTTLNIETGQGSRSTVSLSFEPLRDVVRGIGSYLLSSATAARGALRNLRTNLTELSELRGRLGATGTRLETAHRLGRKLAMEFD